MAGELKVERMTTSMRSRRAVFALLLVVAAACGDPSGGAASAGLRPCDDADLPVAVFSGGTEFGHNVWGVYADGRPRRLTSRRGVAPAIFPDASHALFLRGAEWNGSDTTAPEPTELWKLDLASGEEVLLAGGLEIPRGVAVTPDGTKYAISAVFPGHRGPRIGVGSTAGGEPQPLRTSGPYPASAEDAAWSPDGRSLAYTVTEEGQELGEKDVVIAPAVVGDTSLPRRVLDHSTIGGNVVNLDWSPDGTRLLITSNALTGPRSDEVTLSTGEVHRILDDGAYRVVYGNLAGTSFLSVRSGDGEPVRLHRWDALGKRAEAEHLGDMQVAGYLSIARCALGESD